ncbi:hypothetical protein BKA93DRAFT_821749 [Sparassis latifolia]
MEKDMEAAFSSCELRSDEIKVEPLRYAELNRAVDNALDANRPDPLARYLMYDTPDVHRSLLLDERYKVILVLGLSDAVGRHVIYTVNHGDAIITLEPAPKAAPPRKPLARVVVAVRRLIVRYLGLFNSKEQKKRFKECDEQLAATLKATIGDQIDDMMSLEGFATAPDKQGRGYGTALAKHVSAIADAQRRSIWLTSSNVANTGFYESLDFKTVGEFALGCNNSTWKKPPVVIRIMVRTPQTVEDVGVKSE